MSAGSIEDALRITLDDYRLSRGERRALAKVVEKLDGDEQRLAHARHMAFELARQELVGPDALAVLGWLEDVNKVLLPRPAAAGEAVSEAYFSPDDNCVGRIAGLFQSAQRSVDVCVFTITDDRITDAMLTAHRRGVAIRVISDNDKSADRGSDVDLLKRHGLDVRVDRSEFHMHHKYALFDNRRLLTGSYNWTRSAARHNEENFVVTGDAELVKAFGRAFAQLWEQLG